MIKACLTSAAETTEARESRVAGVQMVDGRRRDRVKSSPFHVSRVKPPPGAAVLVDER